MPAHAMSGIAARAAGAVADHAHNAVPPRSGAGGPDHPSVTQVSSPVSSMGDPVIHHRDQQMAISTPRLSSPSEQAVAPEKRSMQKMDHSPVATVTQPSASVHSKGGGRPQLLVSPRTARLQ